MNKKKIFIGLGIIVVVGIVLLFLWSGGGVTQKGQFSKCMEVCYDLLIMESSKAYCPEQCTIDTGFDPTQAELDEIIADITNTEVETETKKTNTASTNTKTANTNKSSTNINTTSNQNINTAVNTNTSIEVDQSAEFYCEWSWPQKIIYRDTEAVVVSCSLSQPWCNRADGTYDNMGCCTDKKHLDCTNLGDLL